MQLPESGLIKVLDNPATHHAIEADDDKTAQNADVGEQVVLLARGEFQQGRLHVAVGRSPDDELTQNHGDTHHKDTTDIHQNEGTATIHTSLVGETPDVSQAHCRAHCRGNGAHTCRKTCSFSHLVYRLLRICTKLPTISEIFKKRNGKLKTVAQGPSCGERVDGSAWVLTCQLSFYRIYRFS